MREHDDCGSSVDDDDAAYEDLVFEARTDDGRRITSILSSICLGTGRGALSTATSALAWCEIDDRGMTFTVNVAKTLQAVAYIRQDAVFHTWHLAKQHRGDRPDERLEFGIDLATLLECLRIFGGATAAAPTTLDRTRAALHLTFRSRSLALGLQLNERHSMTECEIRSLDIEMPHRMELNLRGKPRPPARVVIAAEDLKSGIDELEWGGDNAKEKRVTLRVTAQPGSLSLLASSTDIGCEMAYPKEALVSFEAHADLAFDYRFQHLRMALRSLKDAHQTQLQLDEDGLLEIKMRFASTSMAKATEMFSHFFLYPLSSEEEELDDDEPVDDLDAGGP